MFTVVLDAMRGTALTHDEGGRRAAALVVGAQDRRNSSRSALIVAASVVGMPCGNPAYVFSVPFCSSFGRQRAGVGVRDDLVVVAVHDQRRGR